MTEKTQPRLEEIIKKNEPTLTRTVELWKSYRDANQKRGKSLDMSLTLYYHLHLKGKGGGDSKSNSRQASGRVSKRSRSGSDSRSGVEFTLNSFEHMAITIRTKQVVGSGKDELLASIKDAIYIRSATDSIRNDVREAMGIFSTQPWQEKIRQNPQDKEYYDMLLTATNNWDRARNVKATTSKEFKGLIGFVRSAIDDLLVNIVSVVKNIKLLLRKEKQRSLTQEKTQPPPSVARAAPVKPATKEMAISPLQIEHKSEKIGTDIVEHAERSVSAMKMPVTDVTTTGTDAVEEKKPEIAEIATSPTEGPHMVTTGVDAVTIDEPTKGPGRAVALSPFDLGIGHKNQGINTSMVVDVPSVPTKNTASSPVEEPSVVLKTQATSPDVPAMAVKSLSAMTIRENSMVAAGTSPISQPVSISHHATSPEPIVVVERHTHGTSPMQAAVLSETGCSPFPTDDPEPVPVKDFQLATCTRALSPIMKPSFMETGQSPIPMTATKTRGVSPIEQKKSMLQRGVETDPIRTKSFGVSPILSESAPERAKTFKTRGMLTSPLPPPQPVKAPTQTRGTDAQPMPEPIVDAPPKPIMKTRGTDASQLVEMRVVSTSPVGFPRGPSRQKSMGVSPIPEAINEEYYEKVDLRDVALSPLKQVRRERADVAASPAFTESVKLPDLVTRSCSPILMKGPESLRDDAGTSPIPVAQREGFSLMSPMLNKTIETEYPPMRESASTPLMKFRSHGVSTHLVETVDQAVGAPQMFDIGVGEGRLVRTMETRGVSPCIKDVKTANASVGRQTPLFADASTGEYAELRHMSASPMVYQVNRSTSSLARSVRTTAQSPYARYTNQGCDAREFKVDERGMSPIRPALREKSVSPLLMMGKSHGSTSPMPRSEFGLRNEACSPMIQKREKAVESDPIDMRSDGHNTQYWPREGLKERGISPIRAIGFGVRRTISTGCSPPPATVTAERGISPVNVQWAKRNTMSSPFQIALYHQSVQADPPAPAQPLLRERSVSPFPTFVGSHVLDYPTMVQTKERSPFPREDEFVLEDVRHDVKLSPLFCDQNTQYSTPSSGPAQRQPPAQRAAPPSRRSNQQQTTPDVFNDRPMSMYLNSAKTIHDAFQKLVRSTPYKQVKGLRHWWDDYFRYVCKILAKSEPEVVRQIADLLNSPSPLLQTIVKQGNIAEFKEIWKRENGTEPDPEDVVELLLRPDKYLDLGSDWIYFRRKEIAKHLLGKLIQLLDVHYNRQRNRYGNSAASTVTTGGNRRL